MFNNSIHTFTKADFLDRSTIGAEVMKFYANLYCEGNHNMIQNLHIGNLPYKMMFVTYLIQKESKIKRKNNVKLDVLVVLGTKQLAKQYQMDIYDHYHRDRNNILVDKNMLVNNDVIIDFTTTYRCGYMLRGRYLPDLIFYDLSDLKAFSELFQMTQYQRLNDKPMVKWNCFYDSHVDVNRFIVNGFRNYDLNKITNEAYKQELRSRKLKRILK